MNMRFFIISLICVLGRGILLPRFSILHIDRVLSGFLISKWTVGNNVGSNVGSNAVGDYRDVHNEDSALVLLDRDKPVAIVSIDETTNGKFIVTGYLSNSLEYWRPRVYTEVYCAMNNKVFELNLTNEQLELWNTRCS